MAIVINGSGTVTGISVGGLPDGIVDSGTLATNSVDSAELIDGSIDTAHIAADQITNAILPAGSVIQFTGVSGIAGSHNSVGDGSDHTSSLNTAAITIKGGTSSKVVITVYQGAAHCQNGVYGRSWLQRAISGGATTQIGDSDHAYHGIRNPHEDTGLYYPTTVVYVDTPNVAADTTITYSARYNRESGSNSFYYLHSGYGYGMTLMEVAQ